MVLSDKLAGIGYLTGMAAAAATSGLASSVLAPGPWRPSKFRLVVETAYFPAGILSSFIARHEEQPGCSVQIRPFAGWRLIPRLSPVFQQPWIGHYQSGYPRCLFLTLHYSGKFPKVLYPAVRAASHKDIIDRMSQKLHPGFKSHIVE